MVSRPQRRPKIPVPSLLLPNLQWPPFLGLCAYGQGVKFIGLIPVLWLQSHPSSWHPLGSNNSLLLRIGMASAKHSRAKLLFFLWSGPRMDTQSWGRPMDLQRWPCGLRTSASLHWWLLNIPFACTRHSLTRLDVFETIMRPCITVFTANTISVKIYFKSTYTHISPTPFQIRCDLYENTL